MQFSGPERLYLWKYPMRDLSEDRFLRIPTALLDALLTLNLTGVQWRIVLWTLRNTFGWNRESTLFTWYRISKELGLDRGGVVRAGNRLQKASVLAVHDHRLGIEPNSNLWRRCRAPEPIKGDDASPRAMTPIIADGVHRNRGRQSSVFRRAKDSSKERTTTYKNNGPGETEDCRRRDLRIPFEKRQLAGAARPIPGKYDGIS